MQNLLNTTDLVIQALCGHFMEFPQKKVIRTYDLETATPNYWSKSTIHRDREDETSGPWASRVLNSTLHALGGQVQEVLTNNGCRRVVDDGPAFGHDQGTRQRDQVPDGDERPDDASHAVERQKEK